MVEPIIIHSSIIDKIICLITYLILKIKINYLIIKSLLIDNVFIYVVIVFKIMNEVS